MIFVYLFYHEQVHGLSSVLGGDSHLDTPTHAHTQGHTIGQDHKDTVVQGQGHRHNQNRGESGRNREGGVERTRNSQSSQINISGVGSQTKKERNIFTVASAYMNKRQCSTRHLFSSCLIDLTDSRRSRVRSLIRDLDPGESRTYHCQVGIFNSGAKIIEWNVTIYGKIKKGVVNIFSQFALLIFSP